MRIIFVRHGEPDYEHDCLTPRGRLQAEAAARRLAGEGLTEIFSSPNGRARETAGCTARQLGLPVQVLDFMHEVSWGGEGVPVQGHPWTLGDWMIAREDADLARWREHPYFRDNRVTACYDTVTRAFDSFLEGKGLRHEGGRFLCTAACPEAIAVFSHGGSGACVLAHLLHLPYPFVLSVLPYDYTSVIILSLEATPGEYCFPRVELFNDAAHIRGLSDGLHLQQESEAPSD